MLNESSSNERLLLCVNSSEYQLQIVLGTVAGTCCETLTYQSWTPTGGTVPILVPAIKDALDTHGKHITDVDTIACVRGPGSFTGIRLSLAAIAGLAIPHGTPTAGLDYLPLLAMNAQHITHGPVHVVTYARRGLVYLQSFERATLRPLNDPDAMTAKEAAQRIQEAGGSVFGSGIRKNPEVFEPLIGQSIHILDTEYDAPTATSMLLATAAAETNTGDIQPMYIRASDAEDNIVHIAAKRGLDLKEAKARLPKYD